MRKVAPFAEADSIEFDMVVTLILLFSFVLSLGDVKKYSKLHGDWLKCWGCGVVEQLWFGGGDVSVSENG
jgi:hypothetical protein